MTLKNIETQSQSVKRAAQLLEDILTIADGGRGMVVEQYEASTILAMLIDQEYRNEVMLELKMH